jgi:hypothetical protein
MRGELLEQLNDYQFLRRGSSVEFFGLFINDRAKNASHVTKFINLLCGTESPKANE